MEADGVVFAGTSSKAQLYSGTKQNQVLYSDKIKQSTPSLTKMLKSIASIFHPMHISV